jgi:hypothetical protein
VTQKDLVLMQGKNHGAWRKKKPELVTSHPLTNMNRVVTSTSVAKGRFCSENLGRRGGNEAVLSLLPVLK